MKKVKFGEVANRINIHVDQATTTLEFYIGGEHINSCDFMVHHRAPIKGSTIGYQFQFGFEKGDILFMTKNPHLRKASMVDFDGLCSIATFVIRTKDESVLIQAYLLIEMQSDRFWNYCEEHKSGGVNYFINWGTLSNYEFDLPPLSEQKVLAEKLWAAYEVKQSYLRMIEATQEMVKSQFIEMFGNQDANDKSWDESNVKDEFTLTMGKTPARNNPSYWQEGTNKWISISDMATYGRYTGDTNESITDKAVSESGIRVVPKGTIIMSFKLSIGRTAVTSEDIYTNEAIMAFRDVDETKFNLTFLQFLIANKNWLLNAKQAVKGQTLNKESIGNAKIIIPPIELQEQFASIYNQADKSVFELRKSIAAIDKVIKSLINENL